MKPRKNFGLVFYMALCFYLLSFPLYGQSLKTVLEHYGIMHANEWIMYYANDYLGPVHFTKSEPEGGGFFPVKEAPVIYNGGLVWCGKSSDGRQPALRAGGAYYETGVKAGWIVTPGSPGRWPQAVASDQEGVRLYRWRNDFFNMDEQALKKEVALLLGIPQETVTQMQADTLRQEYLRNLQEWPADLGAPYYDRNENGKYDPDYDEPGLLGADQLIWYVVSDATLSQAKGMFGALPLGLEVQVTVWSYRLGLSSVVFNRFKLINKSGFQIDSMFVGHFVDCDLGSFADDLVGCDTTFNYGFAYNGYPNDAVFDRLSMAPPAIGLVLLQGAVVPDSEAVAIQNFARIEGCKNLPMTSFWYAAAGDAFSYPRLGVYQGTLDVFANLQGYGAIASNGHLFPFYRGDQFGVVSTPWPLAGDPVTGVGDVDGKGYNTRPSNRAFMVNCGPFTMRPGEEQDLVYAYVANYSTGDQLDALANLQKLIPTVKKAY